MTAHDRSNSSVRARHERCSTCSKKKRLATLVAFVVALQSPTMASTSPHRRDNDQFMSFGSTSDTTSISWQDYSSDNSYNPHQQQQQEDDRKHKHKHYTIYLSEEENDNDMDEDEERVLSALAKIDRNDEDMTGNECEWTQSSTETTTDASNAMLERRQEGDLPKKKLKQTATFRENMKETENNHDIKQQQIEEEEEEDTFLRKLHRFKEALRQTRALNVTAPSIGKDRESSPRKSVLPSQQQKSPISNEVGNGGGQPSRTLGQTTTFTVESTAEPRRKTTSTESTKSPLEDTNNYFVPDQSSFRSMTSEQRPSATGSLTGDTNPFSKSKSQGRLPNNEPISKQSKPNSSYNKQPMGPGSPTTMNTGTNRQKTNGFPTKTTTLRTSQHRNLDSTSQGARASLTGRSRAAVGVTINTATTNNNSHDDVSPWVRKFLSTRPKDCLVLVPRDYLMDNFNLARLAPVIEHLAMLKQKELDTPSPNLEHQSRANAPTSSASPNGRIQPQQNQMQQQQEQQETPQKNLYPIYRKALELILRQKDDPNEDEGEPTQVVQFAAEVLYCLVHARFVVSPRGLDTIRSRIVIHESHRINQPLFGRCPRLACGGMPLLPCGLSDDYIPDETQMAQSRAKRYCCNCRETFHCWDSKVQGCAWAGKSLCHLLLLVYGKNELFPSHFASEGSFAVSASEHSLASTGTRRDPSSEQQDFGRIFGFPLHPQIANTL